MINRIARFFEEGLVDFQIYPKPITQVCLIIMVKCYMIYLDLTSQYGKPTGMIDDHSLVLLANFLHVEAVFNIRCLDDHGVSKLRVSKSVVVSARVVFCQVLVNP